MNRDGDNPRRLPGAALLGCVAVVLGMLLVRAPRAATPSTSLAAVRIDVNTADAAELTALPRIGPALADRILTDRAAHGRFGSVEDLTRVSGIGPKTLYRLRPFVRIEAGVGEAESSRGG